MGLGFDRAMALTGFRKLSLRICVPEFRTHGILVYITYIYIYIYIGLDSIKYIYTYILYVYMYIYICIHYRWSGSTGGSAGESTGGVLFPNGPVIAELPGPMLADVSGPHLDVFCFRQNKSVCYIYK